mgnify:FL=1
MNRKFIIFTDLDSTLLDENYSWKEAIPALEKINKLKIPLILNSSKTICEIEEIRNELNLFYPVVAENGAVVGIPDKINLKSSPSNSLDISLSSSMNRDKIIKIIKSIRNRNKYKFEGFSDWSIKQIMTLTDLNYSEACKANKRVATEPIQWFDSDENLKQFIDELSSYKLTCVRGGRFIHIMPDMVDKGTGLINVLNLFKNRYPKENFSTISLGDSFNDIPMFKTSNFSFLISKLNSNLTNLKSPNLIVSKKYGPRGWNEELLKFLDKRIDYEMAV